MGDRLTILVRMSSRESHLSAQRQLGVLSLGHDDTAFDVARGQVFKRSLAAVCVDELSIEREGKAVHWKIV